MHFLIGFSYHCIPKHTLDLVMELHVTELHNVNIM